MVRASKMMPMPMIMATATETTTTTVVVIRTVSNDSNDDINNTEHAYDGYDTHF